MNEEDINIVITLTKEGQVTILADIDPYKLIGILTAAQMIVFKNVSGEGAKPKSNIITLNPTRTN